MLVITFFYGLFSLKHHYAAVLINQSNSLLQKATSLCYEIARKHNNIGLWKCLIQTILNYTNLLQNDIVTYVDVGGAYVGPTQNLLLRMADEFGVKTYLTNEVEDLVIYRKVSVLTIRLNSY